MPRKARNLLWKIETTLLEQNDYQINDKGSEAERKWVSPGAHGEAIHVQDHQSNFEEIEAR